ncbi:MAG: hypothetical protein PWP04_1765 [Candidatus Atribacteria bacterium]|nr:hypothetical protein [Candidatus Atribacteria bacterium]
MISAIVLAGSSGEGEIEKKFGVSNRSLLAIGGKYMIEYVIDSLKAISAVDEIIVVGPVKDLKARIGNLVSKVVPAGEDPFESTLKGLEQVSSDRDKVLIVTSDLPLLKGDMIEDFLLRCSKKEADFYYSIVRKEIYQKKFGEKKRTFVCLQEGCFTGGNLILLDPKVVQSKKELISRVVRSRKNPLNIARILGVGIIMKYLFKRLTIEEVEKRVENLLKMKAVAVITPYAEIGFDVDKEEHVKMVENIFKK